MAQYDFTTLTLIDDDLVNPTITADQITLVSFLSRAERLSVYETESNQNFSKNFTVNLSELDTVVRFYPLVFTSVIGDSVDFNVDDYIGVIMLESSGSLFIQLTGKSNGVSLVPTTHTYTLSSTLYGTLTKDGTSVTLTLYSSSARITTNQVFTETLTLDSDDTYAYVNFATGLSNGTDGAVSGYVADVHDNVYDLTVNVLGASGEWTATGATTHGPFSSTSEALPADDYVISFSTETGFINPGSRSITLYDDTTINARYIADSSIPSVIQNAECAFALGGNYTDLSGNGLDLDYIGNGLISLATDSEGATNSADNFTAQADSGLVVSDTALELRSSFWFNVRGTLSDLSDSVVLLGQWETVGAFKKLFDCRYIGSLGSVRVRMVDSTGTDVNIASTTTISVDTFYNIFFQFDISTGTAALYINNSLEATEVFTPQTTSSDSISIGNWTGTDALSNGVVDDAVVGSGVLSSDDRTTLFNLGTDFYWGVSGTLNTSITGPANASYEAYDGITTYGPYNAGEQALLVGTYDITFLPVSGYSTPSAQTGVAITEGVTTSISATYTAKTITEVYVRPAGTTYGDSSGDSYDNAITGLSNVVQDDLGPSAYVRIRGTHTEGFYPTRDDLQIDGGRLTSSDPGIIDGAKEVTTTWTEDSTNLYKTNLGIQNIDYIQDTEPTSPTTGERWFITSRSSGRISYNTAFIYDGTEWVADKDWMLKPEKLWIDGSRVNMSVWPSTGLQQASSAVGYTSFTDTNLSGVFSTNELVNSTIVLKKKTWLYEDMLITANTDTSITYPQSPNTGTLDQDFYYIENIKSQCTSHGKWYFDIATGELYVYLDTDPSNYTIEYSELNHGVYGAERDDITLDTLTIKRTNDSPVRLWKGDAPTVTNNILYDFSCRGDYGYNGAGIDVQALEREEYDSATVIRYGDYTGITRLSNCTIEDNIIYEAQNATGIKVFLYDSGNIDRNKIFNMGYSDTYRIHERGRCTGIQHVGTDSISTDDNIGANIAYAGIIYQGADGTISRNLLGSTCRAHHDAGVIYTYGAGSYGNDVGYNVLNDAIGTSYDTYNTQVAGLYTDQYSYDNTIHDNVAYYLEGPVTRGNNNNNSTGTPANAYVDNTFYDDDLDVLDYNPHGTTYATFSGSTNPAESTYQRWDLTVTTLGSDWYVAVNGVLNTYTSGSTQNLPEGAYVISYADDIDDEVIGLTADTTLDKANTETITIDSNWPTGAEIVINSVTYTEDSTIQLEAGDYTAVPNTVTGYTSDGTQSFTVVIGTPQTVTLNYTINPTPVVSITSPSSSSTHTISVDSFTLAGSSSISSGSIASTTWADDRGDSGTFTDAANFTADITGVTEGITVYTVTATSDLGETNTDTITITYTIAVNPVPTVTITEPTTDITYATTSSTIDISGTSSISEGSIVSVAVTNDRGGSYSATGTTDWTQTSITNYSGVNVLTVTATSDLGETSSDVLTVTYTPETGESFMIIEDGTIVTGANSYVSRADYIAYAITLGTTITDTTATDVELISAASFMESKRQMYKGELVDRDQYLSFPRYDVVLEGFYWTGEEIPRQVKLCQMAIALDINAGNDPYNPPIIRTRKSEEVDGAVKVAYFGRDQDVKLSRTSKWSALLTSLLKNSGLGIAMVKS